MEFVSGRLVCRTDRTPYDSIFKLGGDGGNSDSPDDQNNADLNCSICLEPLASRTNVKLQCGHLFHLDCIGSAFNKKNKMQCPVCRNVEQGTWLFAKPVADRNPAANFVIGRWFHENPNVPHMSQNLTQVVPGVETRGLTLAPIPSSLGVSAPARQTLAQRTPGTAFNSRFRRGMLTSDDIIIIDDDDEGESNISSRGRRSVIGRGNSNGRVLRGGRLARGPY